MILTKNQAINHLTGIQKIAVERNRYLPCVVDYVRHVKIDVLADVRADTLSDYSDIQLIQAEIEKCRKVVDAFLMG